MAKSPKQAARQNLKATAKAHAEAVQAVAQSKADGALVALARAVAAFNGANGRVDAEMSRSFASLLASDHALTPKTVSVMIADRIGEEAKRMGSAFSTYRSRNVAFFKETRHLNALRRAVPNPEGMTDADVLAAVDAYLAGLSRTPTQWAKGKAERKAAQARTERADAETAQRAKMADEAAQPGNAANRAASALFAAFGEVSRLAREGTTEERADARAALETLATSAPSAFADLQAWEAEAQGEADRKAA